MALKLSVADAQELDRKVQAVKELKDKIEDEIAVANAKIAEIVEEVNISVRSLGMATADLEKFIQSQAEDWRAEYDEKSEKWQEGDKGSAADSFIADWENTSLPTYDDLTLPDLELEEELDLDAVENLPREVES